MLMTAARVGNLTAVSVLLEHGADIGITGEGGYTALYGVCYSRSPPDVRMVEVLCASGADVNTPGYGGYPPLHWLCLFATVTAATAECLVRHGADLELRDRSGRTALDIYLAHHHRHHPTPDPDIVRLLTKH